MLRSISLSFRSVELGISRRSFARLASPGETVKTKLLASLGKKSKSKGTTDIKDQAKTIMDSFTLKTSTTFTALGLDNNITTALEVQGTVIFEVLIKSDVILIYLVLYRYFCPHSSAKICYTTNFKW